MKNAVAFLLPAVLLAVVAIADTPKPEDPIAAQLFPPEAVMAHQQELGLSDAQRRNITVAVTKLQSKVVEMQWDMVREQSALAKTLSKPTVNEQEALDQADHLMVLEHRIKHEHLSTLIKIKNALTPEQQTRLRSLIAASDSTHH